MIVVPMFAPSTNGIAMSSATCQLVPNAPPIASNCTMAIEAELLWISMVSPHPTRMANRGLLP